MRKHHFPVDGRQVCCRVAGSPKNPTLVLLHGWAGSARLLEPLGERLADRFHVIAVDQPGFGESETIEIPEPFDFAKVVVGVLEYFDVPDAYIVGHSMGGAVGTALAGLFWKRVTALILLDPSNICPGHTLAGWAWVGFVKTARSFLKNPLAAAKVLSVGLVNSLKHPVWMWRTFRMTTQYEFPELVTNLPVDCFMAWADGDEYYPKWEEVCQKLGIKPFVVKNAGHDWPVDDPDKANILIRNLI